MSDSKVDEALRTRGTAFVPQIKLILLSIEAGEMRSAQEPSTLKESSDRRRKGNCCTLLRSPVPGRSRPASLGRLGAAA